MTVEKVFRQLRSSFAVGGLLAATLFACHSQTRVMVGGHLVDPQTYSEQSVAVEQKFAADTACPQAQQAVTVLGVDKEEVTELGVTGCSRKRAYLRLKESQSSWGNVRAWSSKWVVKTKITGEPADF